MRCCPSERTILGVFYEAIERAGSIDVLCHVCCQRQDYQKRLTPPGMEYGTRFEPVILNAWGLGFHGIPYHLTRTLSQSAIKCTSLGATSISLNSKGRIYDVLWEWSAHGFFIYSLFLALRKQLVLPCSSFSSMSLTSLPSPVFFTSLLSSVTTEVGEGCLILLAHHHGL